jgi:tetratricopeptide (TPR) repeat protein
VLVTRFELFLRSHSIAPTLLARKSVHSRQHVLRLRMGESLPTRRGILTLTGTCEALAGEALLPETLFEGAGALVASGRFRLSEVHASVLALLDGALTESTPENIVDAIRKTRVASETAAATLLRAARARIDVNPAEAAEIYAAAMVMAAALPGSARELVAALSAEALKGRANALRHLGRYDDALADLTAAAKLFAEARYCDSEAAQVDLTRAGVLFRQERWAEAAPVARAARSRFLAVQDRRRAAHAEMIEACVHFEEGDVDGARKRFHELRATFRKLRDSDALARVWIDIALCEIRSGDAASARHWLNRASAAFRARRNTIEILRTRWNIAKFIARFGSVPRAVAVLRRVQRAFTGLGMHADAGCVGLDMLELMIQSGAPAETLRDQARDVAEAFVTAGMRVSAALALDCLRTLHASTRPRAVLAEIRSAMRAAEDIGCLGMPEAAGRSDEPA